jgi:hypothetical protein
MSSRVWAQIAKKVSDRADAGKDSEVIIRGAPVPAKKLKKEIRRYSHVIERITSLDGGNSK